MGSEKWTDKRFGRRVKYERDHREWSQAEMAKMLSDKGIQPMHSTTIAKIEAGTRSVRINEALGIADLFGTSLDELLDRGQYAFQNPLNLALRGLHREARQSGEELSTIHGTLLYHLADIPDDDVDGLDELLEKAGNAAEHLVLAQGLLEDVARSCTELTEPD